MPWLENSWEYTDLFSPITAKEVVREAVSSELSVPLEYIYCFEGLPHQKGWHPQVVPTAGRESVSGIVQKSFPSLQRPYHGA
jgi:hypothetical protein